MHPHFTNKEGWCNLLVLKCRAKDPEPAVSGAKRERGSLCSPASAKPRQYWGACGRLKAPGTPTALKPNTALALWLLDGSATQLDVLPPCGTGHNGAGTVRAELAAAAPLFESVVGFVTRCPLALLEGTSAGCPTEGAGNILLLAIIKSKATLPPLLQLPGCVMRRIWWYSVLASDEKEMNWKERVWQKRMVWYNRNWLQRVRRQCRAVMLKNAEQMA